MSKVPSDEICSFIRHLYPGDAPVPLHAPIFNGNEKRYTTDCIDSTFVSYVSSYVSDFEQSVAAFTGAGYAVATVNGTSALHIALLLAGVRADDEVITSPLSFVATANAISYTGAQIVFCDCEKETLGLCPVQLEEFLSKNCYLDDNGDTRNRQTNARIRACVPVHVLGHPVRMAAIIALCAKYNIQVVEDAAESLGSTIDGKHAGTFGALSILSFNGNKIVTTGGGGMVLTDDEELSRKAKHITTTAKVPHPYKFNHDQIAYNYRMPGLNAAVGLAQMEQLPDFMNRKRQLTEKYEAFFDGLGIEFFREKEGFHSNYWLNCIFMRDESARDALIESAISKGIHMRPLWTLLPDLSMFSATQTTAIDNARWIAERAINIPSGLSGLEL